MPLDTFPPLGDEPLDRDADTRTRPEALDAAWAERGTRVLRLRDGHLPCEEFDRDRATFALIDARGARRPEHWYLGRVNGAAVFAIEQAADAHGIDSELAHSDRVAGSDADVRVAASDEPAAGWKHPFEIGSRLDPAELELMNVTLALANWHRSARFSPRDGGTTEATWGGWARRDEQGGEHFPRTDPAVIVLVEHDGRLLLGSNVLWESGRFSLLAGFVEAGESAEQAVVREVGEEAGVLVEHVRYVASQPWPFPRSLMLGFRARLAVGSNPEQLTPDSSEISELRWFTREELRHPGPGLILPRKLSIARKLIDMWIEESGE